MTDDITAAIVPASVVELDAGASKARMIVDKRDVSSLATSSTLVAAVFNMKGKPHPVQGAFKGPDQWERQGDVMLAQMYAELGNLSDPDDDARASRQAEAGDAEQYLMHYHGWRDRRIQQLRQQIADIERQRDLDGQPQGRIAIVPLERKPGAPDVLNLRMRTEGNHYITHIVIGERSPDGTVRPIGGAELTFAVPLLAGHELRMGIRLTSGLRLAPGELLLPPCHYGKMLTAGTDDPS
jgi:hypothetical protein